MSVQERKDVRYVLICAPFEGDSGCGYMVGHEGVTEIRIAKRHGPMDWLPYVEVWKGQHLHSETPQHQCVEVEFLPAQAGVTRMGQDSEAGLVAEGDSTRSEGCAQKAGR